MFSPNEVEVNAELLPPTDSLASNEPLLLKSIHHWQELVTDVLPPPVETDIK
jgi:hypothetical protein